MKVMRTGEVLCWKDGIPGSNAPPHPGRVQISHPGHGGQPNSLGLPVGGMLKLRINLRSSTMHEQG